MVAINAVMAGARPDYLPVILAGASVFGDVQFESMTRSVNSFAFAQLVSGPISREIGMAGGLNASGPVTAPTQPSAGPSTSCCAPLAEHDSASTRHQPKAARCRGRSCSPRTRRGSPWPPFHTDLGYEANDSVVSVLLGGWAHNGNYYYGDLDDVASTLQDFEVPQTGAW